jgi:serine O-acetyltransferase
LLLSSSAICCIQLKKNSESLISATEPNWAREEVGLFEWNPGKKLLKTLRAHRRFDQSHLRWIRPIAGWIKLRHKFWSAVSGADIPLNCQIGGGLLIPHPNGIVVFPGASIGPNCLLFQQVTIGTNGGGAPIIGGHVDIGAGAKVLGLVRIGDHARIGANAVVISDVPPLATAVGVPARIFCSSSL